MQMPDERTYGFNADDAAALVQSIGATDSTYVEVRPRNGNARLQAILSEDLAAAVNTKRDPSTATCRILKRKTNGDFTLSSQEKTVVNRFKHISINAGTYIKIEFIDGEWQPYAADCPSEDSSGSI